MVVGGGVPELPVWLQGAAGLLTSLLASSLPLPPTNYQMNTPCLFCARTAPTARGPLPTAPSGQYHYHMLPAPGCAFTDTPADQHSPAWGIMADGIPIFGPRGDGGQVPSADDDLDECRGHVDAAYPFYHYHATPDVTTGGWRGVGKRVGG